MKTYADTNFFTNYYLDFPSRLEAEALAVMHYNEGGEPFPVTRLLRIELTNALQQAVFLSRNGAQKLRIGPEQAMLAEGMFDDDLSQGDFVAAQKVDEATVEREAKTIIHRYTAKEGFRAYDILHISYALVLGCSKFLSFDVKARKLAQQLGLTTNGL